MTKDEATIKKENIKKVLDSLHKVTDSLTFKHLFALHMYIHAIMHKTDQTAVAAGLEAARFVDKEGITIVAPVDCILAALVSEFGFHTVAEWDDDELADGLDRMDTDKAYEVAAKFIEADNLKFPEPGDVEPNKAQQERMVDAMMKQLGEGMEMPKDS